MTKPFGEDLWKSIASVRVSRDEGIEVPVRAGSQGIRVGLDAVAAQRPAAPEVRSRFASFVRRLVQRG